MNTLRWIWMHFTPRSASASSLDAYVGGSQSLRYAKTSLIKVCILFSHSYLALVLISTAQCITGLRSKSPCANPAGFTCSFTATLPHYFTTIPFTLHVQSCVCICSRVKALSLMPRTHAMPLWAKGSLGSLGWSRDPHRSPGT